MKTTLAATCLALALLGTVSVQAGDSTEKKSTTPEFERMKSLVGTWKGTTDMGQGPVEVTSQYRLVAAGSVVEERIFPGSPNEMVTMYYNKNGKLALTHYCMMGNRPAMVLKSADSKTLKFDFDPGCGINVAKESHMHAMTLRFDDADTITASCKAYIDGKEADEHATTMKRVSSEVASASKP